MDVVVRDRSSRSACTNVANVASTPVMCALKRMRSDSNDDSRLDDNDDGVSEATTTTTTTSASTSASAASSSLRLPRNNAAATATTTSPLPSRVCASRHDTAHDGDAADATARVGNDTTAPPRTDGDGDVAVAVMHTPCASSVPCASAANTTTTTTSAAATAERSLRSSRSPAPRWCGGCAMTSTAATATAAIVAGGRPPVAHGAVVTLHTLAQLEAVLLPPQPRSRRHACAQTRLAAASQDDDDNNSSDDDATTAARETMASMTRRLRPRRRLAAASSLATTRDEASDADDNDADDNDDVSALLRLRAGETAVLLLHHADKAIADVVTTQTQQLAQVRVFRLNLDALPPSDYFDAEAHVAAAVAAATRRACRDDARDEHDGNDMDAADAPHVNAEPELIVTPHKRDHASRAAVSPYATRTTTTTLTATGSHGNGDHVAFAAAATLGCHSGNSTCGGGGGGGNNNNETSTLSSQLHTAVEHVLQYIGMRLRIDLLPHVRTDALASNHGRGGGSSSGGGGGATLRPTRSRSRPRELPQPTLMIVWRAAAAPRDEYVATTTNAHTDADTSATTDAHASPSAAPACGCVLLVKQVHSVDQLHSLCLWAPVYTVAHLLRTLVATTTTAAAAAAAAAALADSTSNSSSNDTSGATSDTKTYTVLYLGASWCPPCMRFVATMPQLMHGRLPRAVVCTMKADMDLARPVFDALGVEVIPTFVVFDNDVVCRAFATGAGHDTNNDSSNTCVTDDDEAMRALLRQAELGRLQNSQLAVVTTFIEKHCNKLSFDDDF